MKFIGYGEDALTLWALKSRLPDILSECCDTASSDDCMVFYRPSFGRRGGDNRSEFGEFDFILFSNQVVYLGESKWDRSSEKKVGHNDINLRPEQTLRHKLFAFYIREWAFGPYMDWNKFVLETNHSLIESGIAKSLPSKDTLLAQNIQTILWEMKKHFASLPTIVNLLLYFHAGNDPIGILHCDGFQVVPINYQQIKRGNLIMIDM